MAGRALTRAEIDERAAVLRRFKKLLEEKRNKFREYLAALERQERSISEGNMASAEKQSELGESIVAELHTIQKVIDPLEALYRDLYSRNTPSAAPDSDAEREIPRLEADLDKLTADIQRQNQKNREMLKSGMEEVRREIAGLKMPFQKKSVYASESGNASVIDIKT